uniref:Uncharacterized protein n=1 Tax=Schistocephalus solidus TaxID=70667 RepID=A0A0V0J4Z6_SCHSO
MLDGSNNEEGCGSLEEVWVTVGATPVPSGESERSIWKDRWSDRALNYSDAGEYSSWSLPPERAKHLPSKWGPLFSLLRKRSAAINTTKSYQERIAFTSEPFSYLRSKE